MGFSSGTVSFRRFKVAGQTPTPLDQDLIEKLDAQALRSSSELAEEIEYGWSGGRHVLDGKFSFENNVFDGCIHCAMRIDTNRFPGSTKTALLKLEEAACANLNPSGFISKAQKREAKDTVRRQVEAELRTGKYRRSRLVPVLWDLSSGILYANASGSTLEKLSELFERTFGRSIEPITSGWLAGRTLSPREAEDLWPTSFAPDRQKNGSTPDYPWIAKGANRTDFLGNEFLVWLWNEADRKTATIGKITFYIDRLLEMECAFGQSGKNHIRGDGPSRLPESVEALRDGKVPRKMGMILDAHGSQFSLTLSAEVLAVAGAKLPDIEDADSPRVVFEERIALLRGLSATIDDLFAVFIAARRNGSWQATADGIRKWIKG